MFSEMLYGQRWRKHRALFEKHYNSRAVAGYQGIQLGEAHQLLVDLLDKPEEFSRHIQKLVPRRTFSLTF